MTRIKPKEIKELIKLKGWSQAELGRKLEMHPSTICRWIEGKTPPNPASILMRIWLTEARNEHLVPA